MEGIGGVLLELRGCKIYCAAARQRLPAHSKCDPTMRELHARGRRHLLTQLVHVLKAPCELVCTRRAALKAAPAADGTAMFAEGHQGAHRTRASQSMRSRQSATISNMHLCSKNWENRRLIARAARVRILLRGGPPSAARALKMRPHGARATRTGQAPIFGTSRLHYRGTACASLRAPLGRASLPRRGLYRSLRLRARAPPESRIRSARRPRVWSRGATLQKLGR